MAYIGIDIGGTSARVALFPSIDSPGIEKRQEFNVSGEYADDIRTLTESIRGLVGDTKLNGIGVSVAGNVDDAAGRLRKSGNKPGWVGKPLKADLKKAFSCPVHLVNDAQAAALAEAELGPHQGSDFWFIIWGTGVGGSIVTFPGKQAVVVDAEPGHQVIRWDETSPRCSCGRRGCLEAYVGGNGIKRRLDKAAEELSEGEWNEVASWLARGLYNIVRVYPVDRIVLGGGIAAKQSKRLPKIERELNDHLDGFRTVRLTPAAHGEDAGLVGSLAPFR